MPRAQRYSLIEPALTVEPGETIVVETINHMTPVVRSEADLHAHGSPGYREREETGPIAVRGARPGDMLAVQVREIRMVGIPHAHGAGPLVGRFAQKPTLFPVEGDRCVFPGGWSVPLAPMIGDIYTMPPAPRPSWFDHGGNMDFTGVSPGNTLYLPVYHDGGLLTMGDVHAAQGDGEIYGEAAECAADVTVALNVDRRLRSPRPVVETPEAWICLAGRGAFTDSATLAIEDMVALLGRLHGMEPEDAYILCTLTGSIRTAACVSYNGKWLTEHSLVGLSVPRDIRRARPRLKDSG